MNQKNPPAEKKKKTHIFIIIIVILVIAVAAVVTFGLIKKPANAQNSELAEEKPEEQIFPVRVQPAYIGSIAEYLEVNGEVITESSVEVYPDTSGILSQFYVELGDYIQKDQVIAEVDPSKPGINYSMSPVKPKVSGTVIAKPLSQGDIVSPQIPVVTIGNLNKLQVVASISERFISLLSIGMPASMTLQAWPNQELPLVINHIDPILDSTSRTIKIKMDIPPRNDFVKAGMYAEIRLTTKAKSDVVKTSVDTVIRRLNETFVYLVKDDIAHKRNVVLGITMEDEVEILEGLSAGELVVYQGQHAIDDGVKVRIIEQEADKE